MPGSAIINTFIPIITTRTPHATRTRYYTFNGEVPIGLGGDDHWRSIEALCSIYVPTSMEPPADGNLYLVSAKMGSINPVVVDDVHGMLEPYDLELDAFLVCPYHFYI
jgi:hypothetical protein